jgi:hypothetical protein
MICPVCIGVGAQLAGDAAGVPCGKCAGTGALPDVHLEVGATYRSRGGADAVVLGVREDTVRSVLSGLVITCPTYYGVLGARRVTTWEPDGFCRWDRQPTPHDLLLTQTSKAPA